MSVHRPRGILGVVIVPVSVWMDVSELVRGIGVHVVRTRSR
ncbi:MAG TPA: hypothetical protein VF097_06495 [Actinomycetota bacterium]